MYLNTCLKLIIPSYTLVITELSKQKFEDKQIGPLQWNQQRIGKEILKGCTYS